MLVDVFTNLSVSQGFTPAGTTTNYPPPQSPENNTSQEFKTTATIPTYSPQSPEYPPQSPSNVDFLHRLAGGTFPLQGELNALSELVDSVRVDLLQTSMIIDYAKKKIKEL